MHFQDSNFFLPRRNFNTFYITRARQIYDNAENSCRQIHIYLVDEAHRVRDAFDYL